MPALENKDLSDSGAMWKQISFTKLSLVSVRLIISPAGHAQEMVYLLGVAPLIYRNTVGNLTLQI